MASLVFNQVLTLQANVPTPVMGTVPANTAWKVEALLGNPITDASAQPVINGHDQATFISIETTSTTIWLTAGTTIGVNGNVDWVTYSILEFDIVP